MLIYWSDFASRGHVERSSQWASGGKQETTMDLMTSVYPVRAVA